jgi:hypothetical protein
MPPWLAVQGPGFPTLLDDRRLADAPIAAIARWVQNGTPPGDLRRAPAPPPFPLSWPLGTPNITIDLPRPVFLPADDTRATRNVVVPIGFPTDLWIAAVDYQSGESRALRQARFFLATPDLPVGDTDLWPGVAGLLGGASLEHYGDRLFAAVRGLIDLGGWTPGLPRRLLPEGLAIRAPARSNLIVQMHLQSDRPDTAETGRVAIYFAKPHARRAVKPIDVPPAFGIAARLAIPAGDPRWILRDAFVLPVDVEAVGARGFAHALAREMTLSAVQPAGATRGLLRIDRWDPNWPESYYFAAPIRLAKGTTIRAEIAYDNSAGNPRNFFVPPQLVVWGRPSVGETGGLSLLIAAPTEADARAIDDAIAAHVRAQLLGKDARRP